MLKIRFPLWVLLIAGVCLTGSLAAAVVEVMEPASAPWQVAAVSVSGTSAGGFSLLVEGHGLPAGLQATLIPAHKGGSPNGLVDAIALPLYQFASDGRLAIASTRDQRLITLDVANKDLPNVLGSLKLSPQDPSHLEKTISALALVGNRAVVAKSNAGLALIDVADPVVPRQIDFLKIPVRLLDMQADAGVVYVASDEEGVLAVTIDGDRLISHRVPGSLPANRVTVDRRRLVTSGPGGELALYQLDPQGNPQRVGTVKVQGGVRDLALAREHLYVCTDAGRLLAFALGNWPQLLPAGELDLEGRPLKLEWMDASRQLYCSMVGVGVAVVGVNASGVPRSAGVVSMPRTPISLEAVGERLFAAGADGLKILSADVLTGVLPPPTITYPFPPDSGKISLLHFHDAVFAYSRSELALLSDRKRISPSVRTEDLARAPFLVLPDEQGVRLHAISGGVPTGGVVKRIPISNQPEKSTHELGAARKTLWGDGRLYVLSPEMISIFEVDHAGVAKSSGELKLSNYPVGMSWLSPGFLVVALHREGLQVVDVRNPATPRVVGGYSLAKYQQSVGAFKDLLIDGNRLYAARARLGVEIYDLSDPAAPQLLQRIDTPGYASSLTMNDGLLLVGDIEQGVFVIDLRGEQAVPVGSYHLPTLTREIAYDGNSLYTTNSAGGVLRLPPPLRLAADTAVSHNRAKLRVPAGMAPGSYQLALYDDQVVVNLPVTLQ